MPSRAVLLALPLLAFLLCLPHLHAEKPAPLTIDQLTDRADLILHATVLSRSCQRDASGRIFTQVDLLVGDVWKGILHTNRFLVVHGGGTLGQERALVLGAPDYPPGEEVLAFLVLNPRGEGVTLGLAQGKFQIHNQLPNAKTIHRNLSSITLVPGLEKNRTSPPASPSESLDLHDLKRTVQSRLARPHPAPPDAGPNPTNPLP